MNRTTVAVDWAKSVFQRAGAGSPCGGGVPSGPVVCSGTDRPVMVGVTLASPLSWFRGRAGSRPTPWLRWRGQRPGVLVRRAP